MGSGRWSTDLYDAAVRYRAASGVSAFAYSDSGATSVHPRLDPLRVIVRESRDSAEHSESLAVAVLFDVTGSMRWVPQTLQTKLPELLGLLLRKGYVAHPLQRRSRRVPGAGDDRRGTRSRSRLGHPDRARRRWRRGRGQAVRHVVVVDLGYGDAGKGTVVDWLCTRRCGEEPVHAVVRFNGGAQAAHNVVTADGRHHSFAQFGSGTFTPGVRTHLSRHVLVDPLALIAEAGHLAALGVRDALDRLTVDRSALVTTPYHRAANRARETARGAGRHGSCGMGVGETMAYALAHGDEALRAGDCLCPRTVRRKLTLLRDRLTEEVGRLEAPGVAACMARSEPSRPASPWSARLTCRGCSVRVPSCSRAPRGCFWTSGTGSTRTPPGPRPPSRTLTRCWTRPARRGRRSDSAWCAPMRPGTDRAPS